MDVIFDRVAAVDIGKKSVVVCVRTPDDDGRENTIREFRTFKRHLRQLACWLADEGVEKIAMESTGKYWLPLWYTFEDIGYKTDQLILVNPRLVRMIPGKKTDVRDAQWLAELCECGLLRSGFVPPIEIRRLRDLTRRRRKLIQQHSGEVNRIGGVLEDAQIKITAVTSKTLGVSTRLMLEALIAGERDPHVLAELAKGKLKSKKGDLAEALIGRFDEHHAFELESILRMIDVHEDEIAAHDARIADLMEPTLAVPRDLLQTIDGIGQRGAEDIIAEIGVEMDRFPSAGHLTSWAGICPPLNESAGKRKQARRVGGNKWLTAALVQCAWGASKKKDSFLKKKFWRLAGRIGKQKAAVAVGRTLLTYCYHVLDTGEPYRDLGEDWYERRRNPQVRIDRHKAELERMGYTVDLTKKTDPPNPAAPPAA